tara:strand:- start:1767 stop:3650 length:1884 start_codon:yes stop_codon:yes gene_type:complete
MSIDLWLEATKSRSTLITSIGFNNILQFRELIENKLERLDLSKSKKNINRAGALLLENLIKQKMDTFKSSNHLNDSQQQYIEKRLEYFMSQKFIDNMNEDIPTRDDWMKNTDEGHSSYIKTVFITDIAEKIRSKLEPTKPPEQCISIIDEPIPSSKCYLCNTELGSKNLNNKLECEHILPILPAISHLWLYNKNISNNEIKNRLKIEYAWSHKCCNRIKNNYDFHSYDDKTNKYIVNNTMINKFKAELIKKIKNDEPIANKSNCSILKGKEVSNELIFDKMNPIVDEMNNNLNLLASTSTNYEDTMEYNYYLYILLCKFKIFAAFSDYDFLNDLLITGEKQYLIEDLILDLLKTYIQELDEELKKTNNSFKDKVETDRLQGIVKANKSSSNYKQSIRQLSLFKEKLEKGILSMKELARTSSLGTRHKVRLMSQIESHKRIIHENKLEKKELKKLLNEYREAVNEKKEIEEEQDVTVLITAELNNKIISAIRNSSDLKNFIIRQIESYPENAKSMVESFLRTNNIAGLVIKKDSKDSEYSKKIEKIKYIKKNNIIVQKLNLQNTDYEIKNLIAYIIINDKYNPTIKEINKSFYNIYKNSLKKSKDSTRKKKITAYKTKIQTRSRPNKQ